MTSTNHPPPPPQLEKGLDSKIAVFGYVYLCLNVLFFNYLLAGDPWTYRRLTLEDGVVENLTAVAYLLAGLLLFAAAPAERNCFRRGIYILGGMAMLFVCGEEINWGQRLFGFAMPDFLMGVTSRSDFNVHNQVRIELWGLGRNGVLLLCMVSGGALLCRKDRLFGIPLPSLPLVLGFLVVLSLCHGPMKDLYFVFMREKELLFVAIYALLAKQSRLFMVAVAPAVLVLAVSYVEYRIAVPDRFTMESEVIECLLGIVCLFYSLECLLAQGRPAAISWAPFAGLKLPERRAFWLTICSLLIGGSIGLMFFGYDAAGARTAALMEAYRSVRSAEPVIRSNFDVYLMRNQLIYLKEPCDPADTEPRFFLHVIPTEANDLPRSRKPHGFDNLDFGFGHYGSGISFGGKCLAARSLPDYKITNIRTGQFIRKNEKGKGGETWAGTFTLNE